MFRLRPASAADLPFLRALADERRLAEWQGRGIEPGLLAPLLAQQFQAQQAGWRQAHPSSVDQIIECGEPVGRLWTDRADAACWTVVDIGLLGAWRGQGLGSRVLQALQAEARAAGAALTLHVANDNPAQRLYGRLGFEWVADQPPHRQLCWLPPPCNERP